jgi:hypothetical protein
MTHEFIGWTPPPGAVVDPPVHPETRVQVIYSDGDIGSTDWPAAEINWSAVGDGPRVVAYAVVREYKPEPVLRERYLCIRDTGSETVLLSHEIAEYGWEIGKNAFLMREVPDPSREVVALQAAASEAEGRGDE